MNAEQCKSKGGKFDDNKCTLPKAAKSSGGINTRKLMFGILALAIAIGALAYAYNQPCNIDLNLPPEANINIPPQIMRLVCFTTDFKPAVASIIGMALLFYAPVAIFKALSE